jgi:uncharacterized protein YxeA
MRNLILSIFASILFVTASKVWADTVANGDFNPFPQMEQDQKSVDDDATAAPQQQNDDWPPANNDGQTNNEGGT